MATSNKLKITDLEFDTIKENLKSFLKSQSQFQDYDFEGSGMSVMVDLLAYNTHYMGYYANMLGNEMILDSSSLRDSAVSHAKHLNVHPTSVRAAKAKIDFVFTPPTSPISLLIAKNTKFTSSINGVPYKFVTNKPTTISRTSAGTYSVTGVEIVEGTIVNKTYTVNGGDVTQRFIIPNSDVDISTLTVVVQKSATDSDVVSYTDGNSYTDIIITCTLNYDEPVASDTNFNLASADQKADDATIDGNFVFDELGLKSKSADGRNKGLLLSHVVFHPVQKSANRKIQVLYTIKVRTNYTAS